MNINDASRFGNTASMFIYQNRVTVSSRILHAAPSLRFNKSAEDVGTQVWEDLRHWAVSYSVSCLVVILHWIPAFPSVGPWPLAFSPVSCNHFDNWWAPFRHLLKTWASHPCKKTSLPTIEFFHVLRKDGSWHPVHRMPAYCHWTLHELIAWRDLLLLCWHDSEVRESQLKADKVRADTSHAAIEFRIDQNNHLSNHLSFCPKAVIHNFVPLYPFYHTWFVLIKDISRREEKASSIIYSV